MQRKSKYGAIPVTHNGRRFASKLEARIARFLETLEGQGKLTLLGYQPVFVLIPSPNKVKYVGDFLISVGGKEIVVDAKGVETDGFRIKKKMMAHFYPATPLWIVRKEADVLGFLKAVGV